MTATPLQPFIAICDLLLGVHKNDAIFTVVQNDRRLGLMTAVGSALCGTRWVGARTVLKAFENPGALLTGWEAYDAIFQNPSRQSVLLYRHIDGLSLYGSLT